MSHRRQVPSAEHDVKSARLLSASFAAASSSGAHEGLSLAKSCGTSAASSACACFRTAFPLSDRPAACAERCRMSAVCPARVRRQQRASRSHTRTLASRPPDSSKLPACLPELGTQTDAIFNRQPWTESNTTQQALADNHRGSGESGKCVPHATQASEHVSAPGNLCQSSCQYHKLYREKKTFFVLIFASRT